MKSNFVNAWKNRELMIQKQRKGMNTPEAKLKRSLAQKRRKELERLHFGKVYELDLDSFNWFIFENINLYMKSRNINHSIIQGLKQRYEFFKIMKIPERFSKTNYLNFITNDIIEKEKLEKYANLIKIKFCEK